MRVQIRGFCCENYLELVASSGVCCSSMSKIRKSKYFEDKIFHEPHKKVWLVDVKRPSSLRDGSGISDFWA